MDLTRTAIVIAERYATHASVESVAMAGSGTTGIDAHSDVDLYVYASAPLPREARETLAPADAVNARLGLDIWEPGDEWVDRDSGRTIDVTFRNCDWIEGVLDDSIVRFLPSLGYSTSVWYNLRSSLVLFDRRGWFVDLQSRALVPYPRELREDIISRNRAALIGTHSSYLESLRIGVDRCDRVSVGHRLSLILASVFDIILALNEELHPGEKRLLAFVDERCAILPESFSERVNNMLELGGRPDSRWLRLVESLISDVSRLSETSAGASVAGAWPGGATPAATGGRDSSAAPGAVAR